MTLVGDRHQLPAVGRGGVLDLAVRYASERRVELDGVHRFADPAYAALSLQMRKGEGAGEVFDHLLSRGEVVVHASDVERVDALAVRASCGDLVVTDTREQVARINALARRVRVDSGDVSDGVVTRAGDRIGVGDSIMTRRNNTDHDVANRETWTVLDIDPAGMTVSGAAGRRHLPPEYVLKDVELAYATTAYGAQGVTVGTSHVLVGESAGAASTYVGMTRGREHNVAHLVADSVDEARRQWIAVFARDRADLGPTHAARRAVDDIDRYGANARRQTRRTPQPRRPELDLGSRTPTVGSGPGIGF